MLDFTWKMTTTPWLVGDEDRDGLRGHGLTSEDLFDLAETVAFFNLSNRMASASDMMPNREYHGAFRAASPTPIAPPPPRAEPVAAIPRTKKVPARPGLKR
jgi:hypothetical protein